MKTKHLLPAMALLAVALSPVFELSVHATVTNVAWYRLGENDPGATNGLVATNSIDVVSNRVLTLAGGPLYDNNVASSAATHVASSLAVRFSSTTWGTNALVSTAVDNFGLEAWVNPSVLAGSHLIVYNGHSGNNGWGLNLADGMYSVLFGGQAVIGSVPAAGNVWVHLALVRNGGTTTFYTNGIAAATDVTVPIVPAGVFSVATAPSSPGTAVFQGAIDEVRVFTFAPGQFSINDLLLVQSSVVPVVTTTAPTQLTTNTATFNGTVNPGGLPATAWFQWGPIQFPYGQTTAATNVASGNTTVSVSQSLSGLTPGLTYHCRLVVSTARGIFRGQDVQFWAPVLTVNSNNPFVLKHQTWVDPGATVRATPSGVSAGRQHSLALKADGTVLGWGNNSWGQSTVPSSAINVVAIAGGGDHSLALKADGTVLAWGDYVFGQSTVPSSATNVVAIAAGFYHSLALKADGTVLGWGNNGYGEIDIPGSATNVVAIGAGSYHSLALKADGTVLGWGYNEDGEINIPASATNVVAIAAGYGHSLAVKADGTVLGWGYNSFGQTSIPAGLDIMNLLATSIDNVNTNVPGSYEVNYFVTNTYGIVATASRSVLVIDSPTISNLSASVLATNAVNALRTVRFSASVNPNGSPTIVSFAYGLTAGYGASGGTNSLPGVFTPQTATFDVPLSPGFTWHWAVVATNGMDSIPGSAFSADQVFTVPAAFRLGDANGDGVVDQSELDAVYANYLPTSPWLLMTNVAGLGGTNVTFALGNSLLGSYSVEVSTNLADWQLLGVATPRYLFTDTNAPAASQSYYRLRYP